mgnify:CR=1 FL=1
MHSGQPLPHLQLCHGRTVPAGPNARVIGGRMVDERCMACARFVPWTMATSLYQAPSFLRRGEDCPVRVIKSTLEN